MGESTLRLEERLGWKHKGIERRFVGMGLAEGAKLAGRVSGDSTVSYGWAYSQAAEAIAGVTPPPRAVWLRALLLERERIANHLGDLGYLGNDVALAFGLAQFMRLKEDWVRLNATLFGHRLLMDRIVPGGVGTTYLHEQLKAGDRIKISGPYGRFFVRKSANSASIFMAGGSGLSSPRSMILDLLEEGSTLPITLVYGQRTRNELYYHEEFVALAEKHPNFTYVPALSDEPADSDWTGFRGYVHDAAKAHFDNDFRNNKAYLCGPPVMIDACITTLMQGRLFENDIYTEKFFSAADAQQVRSPLFKRV